MPSRRLELLVVAVLLVPVGLGARMLPGVIGDVAGGLLYAGLVYVLCALVAPRARPVVLGIGAGVIGVGVELLQLTPIPGAVAEVVPVARYVLGSTFVAGDLVVAMVGTAAAAVVDGVVRRRRERVGRPNGVVSSEDVPRGGPQGGPRRYGTTVHDRLSVAPRKDVP